MIKNIFFALGAIVALTTPNVSAQNKVTVKWDNPGSVAIIERSMSAAPVSLSPDQKEYEFNFADSESLYIASPMGYVIESVMVEGEQKSRSTSSYSSHDYGSLCSLFVHEGLNGKTITVQSVPVDYNLAVPIKVINGSKYVKATFTKSWKDQKNVGFAYKHYAQLAEGENSVPFSSKYSGDLSIELIKGGAAKSIYSVTRNGEEINGGTYNVFSLKNIKPEDKIEIRVFETEEPDLEYCTLTVSLPDALKDCIYSIRDWRKDQFVELTDSKIEVIKDSEVQITMNEGYDFTKFTFGDTDITSLFKTDRNAIRFIVDRTATLKVEGQVKVYGDVEFTVYVMNHEGVKITKEIYGNIANQLDPADGTPITREIQLPDNTITSKDGSSMTIKGSKMTPENTRVFKIKVSEKNPYLYVSPMPGYFINALWNEDFSESANYVSAVDGKKTFYLGCRKIKPSVKATVELNGTKKIAFEPSQAFTMLWNNIPGSFPLIQGSQDIMFDPEYHAPFTLRPVPAFDKFAAYLDGMKLGPDENGIYNIRFLTPGHDISYGEGSDITPEEPETRAGEGADEYTSRLVIFADGQTSGRSGSVLVKTGDGKTVTCYYSPAMRKADVNSFTCLEGTPVTIFPEGDKLCVILDNDLIYGYENGTLVNKLTDGKYTFNVVRNKIHNITVCEDLEAPSSVTEIGDVNPAETEIYNLQGIRLGKDLDSLPAGIYIRGGKKIIKK